MRRTVITTLWTLALLAFLATGAFADGARKPGDVSFLTGPQAGDPLDLALSYVQSYRADLGLTGADLADLVVQDHYTTQHNGVTHVYLKQRLDGIEVWNGQINVNVAADGSIINLGNLFVADLASKVNTAGPEIADRAAIERAAENLGLTPDPADLVLLRSDGGPARRATYAGDGLSRDEIPVFLVYQPLADGRVRLAWQTALNLPASPDWWEVRVDAVTGEVLSKNNLTSYDSYLVIPYPPYDSPEDSGGQMLVVDPADPLASPFAWHDTDGAAGPEFTDTQGNNVDAHDDLDGDNVEGIRPDGDMGGAMLEFTYPFDPALPPDGGTNLEAAIVNLFYVNNVMHDLTYQYGFDEVSGNFQFNTYGRGGLGGDEVEADAQDNAEGMPPSCNNANFATPADGLSPRMQMFRWTGIPNALATVNSPAEIAGDYEAARGCWGGSLASPPTADLEDANPADGCTPLVDFTPGNIALIDRGTCEFGTKALNAEDAGASAAVIVNDQQLPNGIISMGAGDDGGMVTIPAVMIGNADGTTIRGAFPAAVNATLSNNPGLADRDSDFDNGIISHEYGHGISNRLTGGPSTTGCLAGAEQEGEGWSDFWTLVVAAKPGDTPPQTRGVGNYASFLPVDGPGIRNFPYTTDLTINPQTYFDIGTTNVPHGVGEIWMAMVWEVYWELVSRYGFDEDIYTGSGGNNLTIQLVIDGMKLQPCFPDFVEARDAILMADLVNNGGANECEIWRGFAKRGLGVNAIAGNPAGPPGVGDETEDFAIPGGCSPKPNYMFFDGFESGDTSAWSLTNP